LKEEGKERERGRKREKKRERKRERRSRKEEEEKTFLYFITIPKARPSIPLRIYRPFPL